MVFFFSEKSQTKNKIILYFLAKVPIVIGAIQILFTQFIEFDLYILDQVCIIGTSVKINIYFCKSIVLK